MHDANYGKDIDSKSYMLDDPIDTTARKRQNYRDRRHISGCQGLGVREGLTIKRNEGFEGSSYTLYVFVVTRVTAEKKSEF